MYHLWFIIKGQRKVYRKPFASKINAMALASQAVILQRVDRAEVSDIRTGKILFKVESVVPY